MYTMQAFEFNVIQLLIACFSLFVIGYRLGKRKEKKLSTMIGRLNRHVMDLNAELLYGKKKTPVIRLRRTSTKKRSMAN